MLVYMPNTIPGPVPLFLSMNFDGNHTTRDRSQHPDARPVDVEQEDKQRGTCSAREDTRGKSADRWPIELIWPAVTAWRRWHARMSSRIMRKAGNTVVRAVYPGDWGCISAWAWSLSRALDCLEKDAAVDARHVAVVGHSRLGKTALWAGAQDERFALVISNNSGEGGAAITRRCFGETIRFDQPEFPALVLRQLQEVTTTARTICRSTRTC